MANKKVTNKKSTVKSTTKVPARKVAAKKPASVKKSIEKKDTKELTIEVHNLEGRVTSTLSLPEEIFGIGTNKKLIAQAVRVFLNNQRRGTQSTKTRGEVRGSTRKIYRQKGTGRARHGGVRAPIFVHGGIAHGPKPRDFALSMPQKMRQKALFSALSTKLSDGGITVLTGLSEMTPKTKTFAIALKKLPFEKKESVLVVTDTHNDTILRAGRNIEGVSLIPAAQLHTYAVLKNQHIIFMKEAIASLEKHVRKDQTNE